MSNSFDQAASLQKIWLDSFAKMAGAFSEMSPLSPPPDQFRTLRSGMLKVLSEFWNEFMRTPQFMEMMKLSINGAFDVRSMMRENMNRIHEQLETPTKEDVDGVLLAIRHVERRVLDRLEGMEDRIASIREALEELEAKVEQQPGAKPARRPAKAASADAAPDQSDRRSRASANAFNAQVKPATRRRKPRAQARPKVASRKAKPARSPLVKRSYATKKNGR
jgi:hypothetical protein